MSGHSHAKKVKHQKEATNQKKGQAFSRVTKMISVAAKEKGPNPEINYALKMAIETARSFSMPKENIERAIKRGTGELAGEKLEGAIFEAYGPGGIAVIIETITDNTNRTLGEIKQILSQNGGKLGGEGSVKWMFERKGALTIGSPEKKEELELAAIEAGADDVKVENDTLIVYTKTEELEKIKKFLEERGIKFDSAGFEWVPKEDVAASEQEKESCQKLFNALDENDSVQGVYSNLKP